MSERLAGGRSGRVHVALLRGVNNVKANRVAMADLRTLFHDLGFRHVRTLLNSGNVVFTSAGGSNAAAARIEEALTARLQLTTPVIVLSGEEVAAIVRENPFAAIAHDPSRLLVVVPKDAARLDLLAGCLERQWQPEQLAAGRRAAYLWCANGVGKSALWTAVDRALERTGTARNMGTMTKLLALVNERSGED